MKRRVSAAAFAVLSAVFVLSAALALGPESIGSLSAKKASADAVLYSSPLNLSAGEKQTRIICISDYGAAGDGITDDSAAFAAAIKDFNGAGENAALVLENKNYYFESCSESKFAIEAAGLKNSFVIGNGAVITVGGGKKSMNINNCENLKVSGLKFGRKQTSHFVGKILLKNTDESFIRVAADRDVDLTGTYNFKNSEFALGERKNETSRTYLFLDKITVFNSKNRYYDVYIDLNDKTLNTENNFQNLSVGGRVIIPMPGVGHIEENGTINISHNTDIALENIELTNYANFGFVVSSNSGRVMFSNVNLRPQSDETVVFTGWRDGFHCKYNTASIIWKNCLVTGLGDDIINISSNMMYVNEVLAPNEIKCYWGLLAGGSYGEVQPGSSAVIFNRATGELLAETTVSEVIDEKSNHYRLSDNIDNLTAGENICFYIDSHAAPDSQIIDCDFEGTLRFKGAGGTVENSRLKMLALVLYPEDNIEGPIPHDITFSGCDFTGSWDDSVRACANSPLETVSDGCYKLKNISFRYCRGLKREMFRNASNFVETSPDYISVYPEIGYETAGGKEKNIRLGVSNGYKNGRQIVKLVITSDFLCDGFSAVLRFNGDKLKYAGSSVNAVQIDGETLKTAGVRSFEDDRIGMDVLEFETTGMAFGSDFVISDIKAVAGGETAYTDAGYVTRLHGDANSDGRIDITDLVRTKKIISGCAADRGDGADCNSDGKVNADDLSLLRKYLIGADGAFD